VAGAAAAALLVLAVTVPLRAQPARPEQPGATLRLWNRPIVEFRVPVRQVRPAERAANATRRIEALPDVVRPEEVHVEPVSVGDLHGLVIFVRGQTLFAIMESDLDVLQRALADFAVQYELRAHIERPEERFRVLSDLHGRIQDAFNEFGVQIMSPAFESQPERAVVVPRSRWFAAPASSPRDDHRSAA
jgi:hypothetical protein